MASKDKYTPQTLSGQKTFPFESAEEAWLWFVQAWAARQDGARFVSGMSLLPRPCEPIDIMKVVDRLYRQRRLLQDHLRVLRHYGVRQMPPDARRVKEARAYDLWHEALERMELVLVRKKIVSTDMNRPQAGWQKNAVVLKSGALDPVNLETVGVK